MAFVANEKVASRSSIDEEISLQEVERKLGKYGVS
jgi:hypothetical protein